MTWGEWEDDWGGPIRRQSPKGDEKAKTQYMTTARANALEACAEALGALGAALDFETPAIVGNLTFEDVRALNVALTQAMQALAALDGMDAPSS